MEGLELDGVARDNPDRINEHVAKGIVMFLILFVFLAVAWALGRFTFQAAGGLIHLLLIVAVISLIVHFMRGRAAGT
jgi:energy-converting hydrogenase Eha subunit E